MYFRQNKLDCVPICWSEGGRISEDQRESLIRLLGSVRDAFDSGHSRASSNEEWRDADAACSMEQREDVRLLARAADFTGGNLPGKSRLVINVLPVRLAKQCTALKCLGIVRRGARIPAIEAVCDQLIHDLKFHMRFECERFAAPRWLAASLLIASSLLVCAVAARQLRHAFAALGGSAGEFCRGVWHNVAAARDAIRFGHPFERGASEQCETEPRRTVVPIPRRRRLQVPRALREPPRLDPSVRVASPQPRRALLINPFYPKDPHASFGKHVLTPTLALTSIAGATPAGWEITYWDENLLQGPPPREPFPQVVGITVHLTFAKRAFELANWYRRRGALVVLGGLHVISCPDECASHADALAVGEGVQLWPQILRDAEAGALRHVYHGDYRRPYREDPPSRRELLPRHGFLTTSSVIATRGCHNRCGFCYLSTEGLHIPYLMRDVEQVVDEIRGNGEPYAVFVDNNLGSRRDYLRRLCRALQPLEIIWSAAVTIDVTNEPSLVRDMALAGCTGVFIGFESLSDRNLADAHKKTPRTDDYARRVALLHENGIQVNGSFVLGFDQDRRDSFAWTVEWIESNHLECATFHILTPYPGTPLFQQMEMEGRLLHRDWSLYDTAHVVFRPKHMSAEELASGYAWCYERLFSHSSIWRRRPGDARAVLPYLAMSYLYKRSNLFWHVLIRRRLTHAVWHPLVEMTRCRHVRFRRRLAAQVEPVPAQRAGTIVPAGV